MRWHLDRRILCYGNKTVVFDQLVAARQSSVSGIPDFLLRHFHLRLLVTDRFPMTASFHPDIAVPELALPADAAPWAQAEQPLWTK